MRMRRTLAFALFYLGTAIVTTNKTKQNKTEQKDFSALLFACFSSAGWRCFALTCFDQLSNLREWLSPSRTQKRIDSGSRFGNPDPNKVSKTNTLCSTEQTQPRTGWLRFAKVKTRSRKTLRRCCPTEAADSIRSCDLLIRAVCYLGVHSFRIKENM